MMPGENLIQIWSRYYPATASFEIVGYEGYSGMYDVVKVVEAPHGGYHIYARLSYTKAGISIHSYEVEERANIPSSKKRKEKPYYLQSKDKRKSRW